MTTHTTAMPGALTAVTSTDGGETRVEMSIELPATPAQVWRAIADGDELARWFPMTAMVVPGEGGSVFWSWGPGCEGTEPILAWEPGRHLRHGSERQLPDGRTTLIAVDWHIEARGGSTVLRMVQSGFVDGGDWRAELDSLSRGWRYELRSLHHYLVRHAGRSRHGVWVMAPGKASPEDSWEALFGAAGPLHAPGIAGLRDGDAYRIDAATGDVLEGTVGVTGAPKDFSGTVRALDDALVRYVWEGGRPSLYLWTWGLGDGPADAFRARWQPVFDERFPAPR